MSHYFYESEKLFLKIYQSDGPRQNPCGNRDRRIGIHCVCIINVGALLAKPHHEVGTATYIQLLDFYEALLNSTTTFYQPY